MRRRIWTSVSTFLILLGTAVCLFPAHAAAAPVVGDHFSYFNIPKLNHFGERIPDLTIRNGLLSYINGAVPGSEIYGHITTISHGDITQALIAANRRGVAVHLVHDGSGMRMTEDPEDGYPQGWALERYFGIRHKWCGNLYTLTSCVSSIFGATHHIKNWYFSDTMVDRVRRRFSTWVTSYNLTGTSDKQFNDAFVVNNNEKLYRAYLQSFVRFYQQKRTNDLYNVPGRGHHVIPSANVEISYAPQATNDQVAMALSRIDENQRGCTLQVANLSISRSAILDQLIRIKSICRVQVAYTNITGGALSRLTSAGIELRLADKIPIHSKMMLYKGKYDGQPGRTMVWGGSHNWSAASLRVRDEVFVAISHLGIYTSYKRFFDQIWASSVPIN